MLEGGVGLKKEGPTIKAGGGFLSPPGSRINGLACMAADKDSRLIGHFKFLTQGSLFSFSPDK